MIARDVAVEAETRSLKVEEKVIKSVTVSPVSELETKEIVFDVVDIILDKVLILSFIYPLINCLLLLRDIKVAKDYVKILSRFEFRVLSEAECVIHPE